MPETVTGQVITVSLTSVTEEVGQGVAVGGYENTIVVAVGVGVVTTTVPEPQPASNSTASPASASPHRL